MSTIRKQSILSSLVVYLGFALGLVNTYLFTRANSGFSPEQYGLTQTFVAFANILFSLGGMGMQAYLAKFYPYYHDRLGEKGNDQLTLAIGVSTFGYSLVTLGGILFQDQILQRFNNAPLFKEYYFWVFPFGYGLTLFGLLEVYGWNRRQAVLTNFLKEFVFRFLTTILIGLMALGVLSGFSQFVPLYSLIYPFIAVVFLVILLVKRNAFLVWKPSIVTRKFWRKILTLCGLIWSGGLIYNLASVIDTIILATILPDGLAVAGVFSLAQNISAIIQAPQRGIIAAAMGTLAKAWKDKDLELIRRIYQRSSINMLLFSSAMFSLIWLNFEDGVRTFNLQPKYLEAQWVFFFLGMYRVIDMGTGLNAQIMNTSSFWRFEFLSGLLLLALSLPLNYFLTRELGLLGPALSNIIAFTAYNGVRFWFLYNRFRMQPFTRSSAYAVVLVALCHALTWLLFHNQQGFGWIVARSLFFCVLFGAGAWRLRLSPDVEQVVGTIRNRLQKGR